MLFYLPKIIMSLHNEHNGLMQNFENLKSKASQQNTLKTCQLFVDITSLEFDDAHTPYILATRLDTLQPVRVRLNNIDEMAKELKITNRNLSDSLALEKAKKMVSKRDSLADKIQKRHAKYLFCDRATFLDMGNDKVPRYRANWTETVSTSPEIELLPCFAHINIRQAIVEGNIHKPEFVQAEIIMDILEANIQQREENKTFIISALDNITTTGMPQTGELIIQIFNDGNLITSATIAQTLKKIQGRDQQGNPIEFDYPVDGNQSLNDLMLGYDFFTQNAMGNNTANLQVLNSDIARLAVKFLTGIPFPATAIINKDNEYLESLRNFYHSLSNPATSVKLFAIQKIYFGAMYKQSVLKANLANSPLKAYRKLATDGVAIKQFLPTMLAIARYKESLNPYISFSTRLFMPYKKNEIINNDISNISASKLLELKEHYPF